MKQAIILAGVLALTACAAQSEGGSEQSVQMEKNIRHRDTNPNLSWFTDDETGCTYLRLGSSGGQGGLTPRLRSDGQPDCPDVQ